MSQALDKSEITPADEMGLSIPVQVAVTRSSSTKNSVEEVELQVYNSSPEDKSNSTIDTQNNADRTWWEWMVQSANSLGESLNPSYEYGKRPQAASAAVPDDAVAVRMPRSMSGVPHERKQSANTRSKTALLFRTPVSPATHT